MIAIRLLAIRLGLTGLLNTIEARGGDAAVTRV